MGYKVNTTDKKQTNNLWDSQAEALIALLSCRIANIRELKANKTCKELNYLYLRKKLTTDIKNCGPTAMQRSIIKEQGY